MYPDNDGLICLAEGLKGIGSTLPMGGMGGGFMGGMGGGMGGNMGGGMGSKYYLYTPFCVFARACAHDGAHAFIPPRTFT